MTFTTFDASQFNQNPFGPANILDNGGMEIWQRGTSFSSPASNSLTADRWTLSRSNTATFTISQESTIVDNGAFSLKFDVTNVGITTYLNLYQFVENYKAYAGKTVTVSARIRTNTANAMRIQIFDGISSAASSYHTGNSQFQTLSVTYTIAASPSYIQILIGQYNDTVVTQTAYVDSVMMAIGSQPVAFTALHPEIDLARCQRYYEIGTFSSSNLPIANITAVRTEIDYSSTFRVTKRIVPTMTITTTQSTQVQLAPGAFGTVSDPTSSWPSTASPTTDGFQGTANRGSNTTYPVLQYTATWTASADI